MPNDKTFAYSIYHLIHFENFECAFLNSVFVTINLEMSAFYPNYSAFNSWFFNDFAYDNFLCLQTSQAKSTTVFFIKTSKILLRLRRNRNTDILYVC